MTDETQIFSGLDNDILKLTFDDFVDFLTAAGANACEACGSEGWGIGMEEGSDSLPTVGQITSVRNIAVSVWVMQTSCQRCGNMRFYNANRIARWVLDGKPKIQ